MKTLKKLIILFVLFFIYTYFISIDTLPNSIEIFQGEQINIPTLWGINIKKENKESIEASTNLSTSTFENVGNETITVNLFDKIKLKTINIKVLEDVEVIPVGQIVGIKLYTNGVLVVGSTSIENGNGEICKPFASTQIQEGDTIVSLNGTTVNNTKELVEIINESKGEEIDITYIQNEQQKTEKIKPVLCEDGQYKIGLWVRDSAGGVGTITFYNEETNSFAGLGHAITDIDTVEIINISSGEIDDVNILAIQKGEKNVPGKIQGTIIKNAEIGSIYKNTQYGIYGIIKNLSNLKIDYTKKMKVASRQEIELGEATCLSGIDGEVKEYSLNIEKIYLNNNYDNKSMLVKITDEELLEKTGGIVQGMSGSPIIQNGKFIGAITHVFVDSPQIGYAVFGEIMVKEIQ